MQAVAPAVTGGADLSVGSTARQERVHSCESLGRAFKEEAPAGSPVVGYAQTLQSLVDDLAVQSMCRELGIGQGDGEEDKGGGALLAFDGSNLDLFDGEDTLTLAAEDDEGDEGHRFSVHVEADDDSDSDDERAYSVHVSGRGNSMEAMLLAFVRNAQRAKGGVTWGEQDTLTGQPLALSTTHLLLDGVDGSSSGSSSGTGSSRAYSTNSAAGSAGTASGDAGSRGHGSSDEGGEVEVGRDPAGSDAGAMVTAHQLMALFNGSRLFRGGPVPGLQILHCKARLGGLLVHPGHKECSEGIFLGCEPKALANAQPLLKEGYLTPEEDVKCVPALLSTALLVISFVLLLPLGRGRIGVGQ